MVTAPFPFPSGADAGSSAERRTGVVRMPPVPVEEAAAAAGGAVPRSSMLGTGGDPATMLASEALLAHVLKGLACSRENEWCVLRAVVGGWLNEWFREAPPTLKCGATSEGEGDVSFSSNAEYVTRH